MQIITVMALVELQVTCIFKLRCNFFKQKHLSYFIHSQVTSSETGDGEWIH